MSSLVAREVHVADLVQELHASLPFINGQLDLAGKVMDVLEQRRKNQPCSVIGLRSNGTNDIPGEVGIESVSHFVLYVWIVIMEGGAGAGAARSDMDDHTMSNAYSAIGSEDGGDEASVGMRGSRFI
jgi:hypothetical protein